MVYVFLADGFEEIEALAPVDILRRGNVEVKTVGVTGNIVNGSHGIPVVCDIALDDVKKSDIEAVVLPGGLPGATNLEKSAKVQEILDFVFENNIFIAAICAAPSILGHKGFLKGRKATCYSGFETELFGADYTGAPVESDGNIITARGAGVALDFGFELLSAIKGSDDTSKKLIEGMLCK